MKGVACAVVVLALAGASAPPRLAGCPVFPTDNPWNKRVDRLPVASNSAAIVTTIGADRSLHPDFGSGLRLYPARHYASDLTEPSLPPMGLRLRLRADYPIGSFPPQARVVLQALERYGMIVADNGSSWYITGAPDRRWSNDDLRTLGRVKGSDFEVVASKR